MAKKQSDIVKASKVIKKYLIQRWDELGVGNREIIDDAALYGYTIQESQLSRYKSQDYPFNGGLTQHSILWLCVRYGISNTLKTELMPYNLTTAEKNLKLFFNSVKRKDEASQ